MSFSNRPLRRSALVGPWGVGAIVPFPHDESLMIAGLDMWYYTDPKPFIIKDERLEKRLGVKELRWPPDYRDIKTDRVNCNITIPAVRFPRWHYCPYCGSMKQANPYGHRQPSCDAFPWENGRKCDPDRKIKNRMIPERFVVVCPSGHIDDFPVAEWLHHDSGKEYDPDTCHIRRSTGGTSAALTGVRYQCTCGANKSIAAALRPGALKKINYKCKGSRPWLGIPEDKEHPCNCDTELLKVVQRGATNVWFPDTRSSIHIPTDDEKSSRRVIAAVNSCYKVIANHRVNGELDRDMVKLFAESNEVDADELYEALKCRIESLEGLPEVSESMSEDEYRMAEYKKLIKSSGSDVLDFFSVNKPIDDYHPSIRPYFNSISLVHKLHETRALVGFSRLEPCVGRDINESKKTLRLGKANWLPAIEVFGEGIFIEFNHQTLKTWAERKDVKERIGIMNKAYRQSFYGKHETNNLRPEFVLLHTFAHILINQLSYECGYGSSSIRERIYCEKCADEISMCGVLLYTASGDSEGSLGGLVRQGEPGRLEETIITAIYNAEWCSSDPICIESRGQGPDSCNLSACHNCALLPETCCENGNRLLDRGVVVGILENKSLGFFDGIGD